MKNIKYIIFRIKDLFIEIITQNKCPRCGNKMHRNLLGFRNCAKCFQEYTNKMLGEDYDNDFE